MSALTLRNYIDLIEHRTLIIEGPRFGFLRKLAPAAAVAGTLATSTPASNQPPPPTSVEEPDLWDVTKTAAKGMYDMTTKQLRGDWKGADDALRYVQKHNKVPTPRLIHPSDEDEMGNLRTKTSKY